MDGQGFNLWDAAAIGLAGYCAWIVLVRLMARRREKLVEHLHEQLMQKHDATRQGGAAEEASSE